MNRIKIELKDNSEGYSFAIGRLDKDIEEQKLSIFESNDKKEMIKWLNKTIRRKCKKTTEDNLWFCFDYKNKKDIYTIDEINKNLDNEGIFII